MAEDGEETNAHAGDETPKSGDAEPKSADSAAVEPSPLQSAGAAGFPGLALNIWPPSQRTRDAVISRLIENLSTRSVLSNRYGVVSADEASATASCVEQEAFDVAAAAAADRPDDSIEAGIEVLQIYSKEISSRVLESVKARGSSPSPLSATEDRAAGKDVAPQPTETVEPAAGSGEDVSSVESESLPA